MPELSVGDNVALALEMQGEKNPIISVKHALHEVGLDGFEKRKISELSGGQRQRVAIARTLVKRPAVIFADEPTGALDTVTGTAVLSLLKRLSSNHLVITVTHDRTFAEEFGDRIIELDDGNIIHDSAQEYKCTEPTNFQTSSTRLPAKTAIRVGSSNFKYHPFRLAITFFLCFLALSIFGLSASLVMTNANNAAVDSIYASKLSETLVQKRAENNASLPITEQELSEYQDNFSKNARGVVKTEMSIDDFQNISFPSYYSMQPHMFGFLKEGDFSENFIGRFAKTQDEIMLTRYTAEQVLIAKQKTDISQLLGDTLSIDEQIYTITAIIDTHFDGSPYETLKTEEDDFLLNHMLRVVKDSRHNTIWFSHDVFAGSIDYSALLVPLTGLSKQEIANLYNTEQENSFEMTNFVIDAVNESMNLIYGLEGFFSAICAVCGVFSAAIILYFISQSIEDKASTIAVLKTMGAGKTTIWKIFLWESILFGLLLFIFSAALCAIVLHAINAFFIAENSIFISVFHLKVSDAFLLLASTAVCTLIGAAIPMYKINKTNPLRFLD